MPGGSEPNPSADQSSPNRITVGDRRFFVALERRIAAAQRSVIATAYDPNGQAVAIQEMTTAAAKGYLGSNPDGAPPSWEQLEQIATDLLRASLDE